MSKLRGTMIRRTNVISWFAAAKETRGGREAVGTWRCVASNRQLSLELSIIEAAAATIDQGSILPWCRRRLLEVFSGLFLHRTLKRKPLEWRKPQERRSYATTATVNAIIDTAANERRPV